MKETSRVLIPEDKVDERIAQLGEQISRDYAGRQVHLIGILKGSIFFICELAKRITVPVTMDFMSVSSYGAGTKSSGVVKLIKDLDEPIESGHTLSYLLKNLSSRNPASIRLCTLLDKPERREVDVEVDYQGFSIPDEFVIGYGLDYDQRYRNLPYIGVLSLTEE